MKKKINPKMMAQALRHLRRQEPGFSELIRQFPRCPLDRPQTDLFDTLVSSIVGQQLSVAAAHTIGSRLLSACNKSRLEPAAITALSEQQCRSVGLSAAKTRFIKGLAQARLDGRLNFRQLAQWDDDAVIEQLVSLPGVGVWTAQMFLMFGLRRPDIAAPADVGLQRGMQMLCELPDRPDAETFMDIAASWRPYRSVASWYLWRLAG
ncbi:MAG: DNA-3-methyladenine glycosylase [Pseudomonadota bacterium]